MHESKQAVSEPRAGGLVVSNAGVFSTGGICVPLHLGGFRVGQRDCRGIVDYNVDASEPLHGLVDGSLHVLFASDVALDRQRLSPRSLHLRRRGEDRARQRLVRSDCFCSDRLMVIWLHISQFCQ